MGLDAAGKTTILYKLKLGEIVTTIPTIGEWCDPGAPMTPQPIWKRLSVAMARDGVRFCNRLISTNDVRYVSPAVVTAHLQKEAINKQDIAYAGRGAAAAVNYVHVMRAPSVCSDSAGVEAGSGAHGDADVARKAAPAWGWLPVCR